MIRRMYSKIKVIIKIKYFYNVRIETVTDETNIFYDIIKIL